MGVLRKGVWSEGVREGGLTGSGTRRVAPLARFESGRVCFVSVVVAHVVVLSPCAAVITTLQAPRVGPVPIIHVVWPPNVVRGNGSGRTKVVLVPLVVIVLEAADEAASLRAEDAVGEAAAQTLAGARLWGCGASIELSLARFISNGVT